MKSEIKKNLWWIITSVVLFIPIAFAIHHLPYGLSDKLSFGVVTFALLFLIWAIIGLVANKIKKIVWKVLWIILGTLSYIIAWLCAIFVIAMSYPLSEEDIEDRKDAFRDMVYREFDEDDHLDKVVGVQLPQYKIVDSECKYVSFPPAETEYDVKLNIYISEGISESVWNEIYELASKKASNPHSESDVINKWKIDEDNPNIIYYTSEDNMNVGCTVTFKQSCDTIYVTRYKW
jgi:energy-coupling factor transporter transmembrane protein EcfT